MEQFDLALHVAFNCFVFSISKRMIIAKESKVAHSFIALIIYKGAVSLASLSSNYIFILFDCIVHSKLYTSYHTQTSRAESWPNDHVCICVFVC